MSIQQSHSTRLRKSHVQRLTKLLPVVVWMLTATIISSSAQRLQDDIYHNNECDYKRISYDMCIADEECMKRFFIEEDSDYYRDVFYYLVSIYIEKTNTKENLKKHLCIDSTVRQLWQSMLRGFNYCKENEVYETGIGCICENGKVCDEIDGYENIHQTRFVRITVAVIFIITVYMLLHVSHKLQRLQGQVYACQALVKMCCCGTDGVSGQNIASELTSRQWMFPDTSE